ncbi:hypothetical protein PR048_022337 [Dryococelus australis]|uniref:Uncharacterized protein n=1 Tax=Dryococelus australis TaxID=614101 RepID=A0ABQ9H0R1_9NEOP|nr:hypothetical protein PR048_022337 [Dryococelus australis]
MQGNVPPAVSQNIPKIRGDITKQCTFTVNSMTKIEPTQKSMYKLANNFAYYLTVRVSEKYAYTAWDKLDELGIVGPDNRDKLSNNRKTDEVILEVIRSHIKSFPVRELLLTYSNTKTLFRWEPINFSTILAKNVAQQKRYVLRNTRTRFFSPKKDQCVFCMQYNNASREEKVHLDVRYQNHIKNKQTSREMKRSDMEIALKNSQIRVCH